jgi:hypothetical protein
MLEAQLNHLQRDSDLLQQRMALKELVWQVNDRSTKGRRGKK